MIALVGIGSISPQLKYLPLMWQRDSEGSRDRRGWASILSDGLFVEDLDNLLADIEQKVLVTLRRAGKLHR